MMATHRAGTLVVGVSAGGVPGAAARVRDEVAARFDDRYADALRRLASVRRAMIERGASAEWRALASEILDESFRDAVESGALEARMATWR
jgi:siroheme synthase (precorrin-2 oxidase/ferrochelatase)